LRGQWSRRELRQSKAFHVVLAADPVSRVNQVLLHVTGERNRSTKPDRTQPQEVADELDE
jgi:hypothetical protein